MFRFSETVTFQKNFERNCRFSRKTPFRLSKTLSFWRRGPILEQSPFARDSLVVVAFLGRPAQGHITSASHHITSASHHITSATSQHHITLSITFGSTSITSASHITSHQNHITSLFKAMCHISRSHIYIYIYIYICVMC